MTYTSNDLKQDFQELTAAILEGDSDKAVKAYVRIELGNIADQRTIFSDEQINNAKNRYKEINDLARRVENLASGVKSRKLDPKIVNNRLGEIYQILEDKL